MTPLEIATLLTRDMLQKAGVREWEESQVRADIVTAAVEMAANLAGAFEANMATSKLLLDEMDGTPEQIVFADHATDFSAPTAANDLRITTDGSNELDVQLDLTSVANAAARQSAKFDFGAIRAPAYAVRCAFEIAPTPTAGNTIDLYMNFSQSATAATANMGGTSGSDAEYTGYSSNLSASLKHLVYIGSFVCTAQATTTIQIGSAGEFTPLGRYGSLVVVNNSGAALHSDAAEMNIVFDPVFTQAQAA